MIQQIAYYSLNNNQLLSYYTMYLTINSITIIIGCINYDFHFILSFLVIIHPMANQCVIYLTSVHIRKWRFSYWGKSFYDCEVTNSKNMWLQLLLQSAQRVLWTNLIWVGYIYIKRILYWIEKLKDTKEISRSLDYSGQNDKQWPTPYYIESSRLSDANSIENRGWCRWSGRVGRSCSTSGICRAIVKRHERQNT